MKIKHVIATDFMSWGGEGDEVFPDNILKLRYKQFNDFFVKTLANQTNKDFTVFVTLHDNIPDSRYKDIIERSKQLGYEVGRRKDLIEFTKKDWYSFDRIIASRLDLDDLVNKDCVSDLHRTAETIFKPTVVGYDNCIILNGLTGSYYQIPCPFQRSQMQSAIFNTSVSSPDDYVCPNAWDNSAPLREFPSGSAILRTDHTKDAAVWFRHENAGVFNRLPQLLQGQCRVVFETDYLVRRFGTLGYSNIFDFSIVLSIDAVRRNRQKKIFDKEGLPRPRLIGGCSDQSIPSKNIRSHKAHYLAIKTAKENDWPFVFIIEDDAYPRKDCLKLLNTIEPPDDADVYMLGYSHGDNDFTPGKWCEITREKTAFGIHAYVVRKSAYDKIMKWHEDTQQKITTELCINNELENIGLKAYVYGTPLFTQYTVSSSVNGHSGFFFFGDHKDPPEGFNPLSYYGL